MKKNWWVENWQIKNQKKALLEEVNIAIFIIIFTVFVVIILI